MKTLFDADILMENPNNFVKAERLLNIIPNNPYYVEHGIYFAQSLTVFKDALRTERLILGLDYEYNALDSIASEQSNKDCYRAVIFLKSFPIVYIDYHSYGDIISADCFNVMSTDVENLTDTSDRLSKDIQILKEIVAEHKANTKPHGATESIVPLSVPLRTESGTLKAADAKNDNDLTTFAQTKTRISDAKNEMTAKLKEAKEELTHQINTKIEDLIDNAPDALNTLKELADALTENKDGITAINIALANRYTKEETDKKFVAKAAFVLTDTTLEITL